jgi:hypothetical protein
MAAVYSDFLFRAIGRDIGKEHLQTQWGRSGLNDN